RPVALADRALLPRPGHDVPPPAAVAAEGHAVAVGSELPQLPGRRRGALARGASPGPDPIELDLRADPSPGRRLVPGQALPQSRGPAEGPRRRPGAGHRIHVRRPRPPRLGRSPPAVDDASG